MQAFMWAWLYAYVSVRISNIKDQKAECFKTLPDVIIHCTYFWENADFKISIDFFFDFDFSIIFIHLLSFEVQKYYRYNLLYIKNWESDLSVRKTFCWILYLLLLILIIIQETEIGIIKSNGMGNASRSCTIR